MAAAALAALAAGGIAVVLLATGVSAAPESTARIAAPLALRSTATPASRVTDGGSPTPSSAPSPPALPAPSRSPALAGDPAAEAQVVALVNTARAGRGCAPVQVDPRLRTAARAHSGDMARHGYFNHTGSDGSSPADRAQAAGYQDLISENIAFGYATPADVMRAWMKSPHHRANVIDCAAQSIGVGLIYSPGGTAYWTQLFGRT